jgi:bile acid:Na+ symporter, BASS family
MIEHGQGYIGRPGPIIYLDIFIRKVLGYHSIWVDVRFRDVLSNNALMMIIAFIIAMLLGGFPEINWLTNSNIAMLSLMVMMSISLTNLKFRELDVKDHLRPIGIAFFLSFILSSGTTILMAYLFQGDIRDGWILEAAVPSAVSVIPFCYILKGNLESTMVASAALYIVALAVTPLFTLLFIGEAVSLSTLVGYVGLLILIPILISRPLRYLRLTSQDKSIGINIAFFVLVVAIAGANRGVFFGDPILLAGLLMVAIVRTFGIGIGLNLFWRRKGVPRGDRIPQVLFSTHKNTGMAAALSVVLISQQAAIPATICMTVDIAWLIFVSRFMFPHKKAHEILPADI